MSFRTGVASTLLATTAILACSAPAAAQAATATDYDLPAQDLETSLRSVGLTSGQQIMITSSAVAGRTAPVLKGQYTVEQAVRALLHGTAVRVQFKDDTILIGEGARADAIDTADANPAEITVIGSRIRGGPATSPVTSITRREAELLGRTDLGQIIRDLPQNFSGGQNPTISASGQGGFTNVSGSSAINLRGLGPDASLTLFNGHRVAFDAISQGVDISAIPLSAIERIDIVTDGASALYGSDAVAGVANVVLRRQVDKVITSARLAGTTAGGGFTQQYNVVGGPAWASGSLMVAADYQKMDEVAARQRAYTSNLPPDTTLLPRQKQVSIVAAGRQTVSESVGLEFDGHYMHRSTSRCITASISPSCYGQGSVVDSTVDSWSVTPSLQVELGTSWSLRLSGTYGESNTSIATRVFFNGAEAGLAVPQYENKLGAVEIGAEGRIFSLPGGEARIAIGGGFRSNKLRVDSRRFVGGVESPIDIFAETRNVAFGYGELSLPLVSPTNGISVVNKLHFVGALRFESHRGIDQITTPKVGMVYAPLAGLEFKASWGKSFKVPTLYQTGQTSNAQLVPGFIFSPAPAVSDPVLYLFGGNPNLSPERATTLTASLTIEPVAVDGLRLDLGYFRIRYRNRVASPFSPITSAFLPVYAYFVQLNPTALQVNSAINSISGVFENSSGQPFNPGSVAAILDDRLQNISLQLLRGMDASIKYSRDVGDGAKVWISGSLTYLDSTRQIVAGQPEMSQSGLIFRPPNWRGKLSGTWEEGDVSLTAAGNYIGTMKDDRFQPVMKVPSFVTVDAILNVSSGERRGLFGGTTLTITIQNLFDEIPPSVRSLDPAALRYDSVNHSTLGRTFGLTVSKAW
ncbi:TonB-dependent receptor [Sphingopyxis bauzanensis]|uniref:TonB-dependent receptor n=1 Tax=Sphingopyxis bauzanensis TaxID=651663 RepID=A0A246JWV4_9SPHN|nr:TonB-dependent receptor [Sphingopyxis bauzanensis]OWQ97567.1 TonB-dependent receptor [Sphingopyxis bauzanensis]